MAIIFDADGNLVDTEGKIEFPSEYVQYTPDYFGANSPMLDLAGNTRPVGLRGDFSGDYDPAFGNVLSYITGDTNYPQSDILPFFSDNQFDTDQEVPNLQRALGNPRFSMEPTGIMEQAPADMMQQVQDDDLEDNAVTVDELGNLKQPSGFKDFLRTMLGFAIPGAGLFTGDRSALEGIKSLNQRLRNTDFGQSNTLMEYLGKRQARKEAERLAPIQKQLQEASERGGGYQPTTKSQNVARTSSRVSDGKTRAYGL
jgi:hypothetical protein